MTQDPSNLARIEQPRRLATRPPVDMSDVRVLTKREGLVAPRKRINPVATISLGYKTERGIPQPTRKGDERYIHVHDAQPRQLLEALERRGYRSLTISLAGDTWPEFVQQRYALYSQTALQVYGDDDELAFIHWQYKTDNEGKPVQAIDAETRQPKVNPDGSPVFVKEPLHVKLKRSEEPERYAKAQASVDVHSSIYFYLAEWEGNSEDGYTPRIVFDGEGGMYRIRTTSQHSIDNLTAAIEEVRRHTGGPICGVPLELTVDFPEVADPWGKKRVIPVFSFRFRPPFRYTASVLPRMLAEGIKEGQALALPAPRLETLEGELSGDAYEAEGMLEGEAREVPSAPPRVELVAEPTDEDVRRLEGGGLCDARKYERRYFAAVRGTHLEGDDARAKIVRQYTGDHEDFRTDSLAEFLARLTVPQADAFIAWVLDQVPDHPEPDPEPEKPKATASDYEREYASQYPDEEPARFGAGSAPQATTAEPEVAAESVSKEPATRQRPRRQPDGSLVDEVSGQILEAAPEVRRGPEPTSQEIEDETDSMGEAGWAESMGLIETATNYSPPAASDAPSLPLFGDAPGLTPADAMAQLAGDVQDPRTPDELFPDDASDEAEEPEEEDERPALTTAAEIWQEATRLGVVCDPPLSDWTDPQLEDYAKGLMPRITAAEKGRKRRQS